MADGVELLVTGAHDGTLRVWDMDGTAEDGSDSYKVCGFHIKFYIMPPFIISQCNISNIKSVAWRTALSLTSLHFTTFEQMW